MDYILLNYYASYLTSVRKLSSSSVNHYLDAINWVSRYLVKKGVLKDSLYEVLNVDDLEQYVNLLLTDEEFVSMNKRGHQMYTAGLNNYIRFAKGEEFEKIGDLVRLLDKPVLIPNELKCTSKPKWVRSEIVKSQTLKIANYKCEINDDHKTFIEARNGKQYMEGHHTIPMKCQSFFNTSLDVYANIVCICPVCHRLLHFGRTEDKLLLAEKIYYNRADRLAHSGIALSHNEFLDIVIKG